MLKVINRSWLPDSLVERSIKAAADFVGLEVDDICCPITVNNQRKVHRIASHGAMYKRRISGVEVPVRLTLNPPSKKALAFRHENPKQMFFVAEEFLSMVVHETTHIKDALNGEYFSSMNLSKSGSGRRPRWEDRPEEIRAIAEQERAKREGFYDSNADLVCEIAIVATDVGKQTWRNRLAW